MNNRLGELPSWANEPDDDDEDDDDLKQPEADIERVGPRPNKKSTRQFFHGRGNQGQDCSHYRGYCGRGTDQRTGAKATTTEKEQELSRRLRKTIDTTNKQAKAAKNLIGELKAENEQLKKQGELKASDLRVRENLLNTLTRKFIDEMKAYQASQQKYKTDIQNKMKRQVKVVKPDATDEEVEEIMRSEGGRDALYKQTILAGGVNDEITAVTAKVAGKYQDVKALEQSVAELHQMFLDFALLVEQQGELLNNIEHQVRQAADHVEEANKDVYQSIELQKSIRKKQLWIILIVVIVLVVILFATGIIKVN
ncbi:Syntaxin [Fragilaria crotonensis]|nr:Syntaxin [Fragilaria crotonensis]